MHSGAHLGTQALRASDYAILGLTMILACISDCFFSDWSPVNSNNFGDRAADRITVCHGIFQHGSSQFVNAICRQSQANAALFPTKYNFRLQHFDNACAIWDHQKWQTLYSHTFPFLYLIYSTGSSGSKKSTPLLLWHLNVPREIQFGCRPPICFWYVKFETPGFSEKPCFFQVLVGQGMYMYVCVYIYIYIYLYIFHYLSRV